MGRTAKRLGALTAIVGLTMGVSACGVVSGPDMLGLYYMEGPSDGYKFGQCIEPGQVGPAEWNNSVVYLPTNLRTWVIDDMPDPADPTGQRRIIAPGADSMDTIIVSAKPEKEQPSGVQVRLSTKTSFHLNTFCDAKGGVAKEFWEKIGRRYGASFVDSNVIPQGWRDMLNAELVPIQKTIIKDVVRNYGADAFIANAEGVQNEAQKQVGERLAVEFNRISGGQFFCGPSFVRTKPDCPPLELLIIGVEYADPGIQAARNEKVKAVEMAAAQLASAQGEAAALVAEAKGKKDAAAELAGLYNSPGWVALQKQIVASNALVEACKLAKECKLIVGPDGNLIMA
jgi:hypothetical protein